MSIILASYVIHLCRTKRDTGALVAKHHFYSPVDCRAVPYFVATVTPTPRCLSTAYANALRTKSLDVSWVSPTHEQGNVNSRPSAYSAAVRCREVQSTENTLFPKAWVSLLIFKMSGQHDNCGRAQISHMCCGCGRYL